MTLLPTHSSQSRNPADAVMSRRLDDAVECAGHWLRHMPNEAARLARRARLCTAAAALCALLAGLLTWPVIARWTRFDAQVLVSALCGLVALTVVAPHLLGLTDRSDEAVRLCGTYATLYRELLDVRSRLVTGSLADPSQVTDIVALFERIHQRTDALRPRTGRDRLDDHPEDARATRPRPAAPGAWATTPVPAPEQPPVRVRGEAVPAAGVDAEAVLVALIQMLASKRGQAAAAQLSPSHLPAGHTLLPTQPT